MMSQTNATDIQQTINTIHQQVSKQEYLAKLALLDKLKIQRGPSLQGKNPLSIQQEMRNEWN